MRKVISLSALVSGLLAVPGIGGLPPARGAGSMQAEPGSVIAGEQALSAEARKRLDEELADLAQNGPSDIGGMRKLQFQMNQMMRAKLAVQAAARSPAFQTLELADAGDAPAPAAGDGGQEVQFQLVGPASIVLTPAPGQTGQQTEKGSFLGVTTSPVPALLREQLELPKGMGLVVDFVAPDSPAQAAGVKVHDVLHKLDDQLLVNTPQLAVLVRSKKPGDTVTLTVIRGAKPVELKAKLVEREVPVLEEGGGGTIRIGNTVQPQFGTGTFQLQFSPGEIKPAYGSWQATTQTRVVAHEDGSTTTTLTDAADTVVLTRDKDGKKTLEAKDRGGKVIFSGAYNTEDDRKRIPDAIAGKVATMEALPAGGGTTISMDRTDDQYAIHLTINGEQKTAAVSDVKTGKIIYTGPANTDEDFKKMPADVMERVKALEARAPGK